jgi:hypothetical protein
MSLEVRYAGAITHPTIIGIAMNLMNCAVIHRLSYGLIDMQPEIKPVGTLS